jgi:ATP-dependent Lon protease
MAPVDCTRIPRALTRKLTPSYITVRFIERMSQVASTGIQQKIRAAYDAGVKEVLLPADNFKEAQELPSYILDTIKLIPVLSVDELLKHVFVPATSK